MARWRIGRGWTDEELQRELARVGSLRRNFDEDPDELQQRSGWLKYGSESILARVAPGPPVPDGPFARGRQCLESYDFSDRRIVRARFDATADLLGRRMLLELRAFRIVRFLAGVEVGAVRDERTESTSTFGFRYDTLEGHIERGSEWFVLTQDHRSGRIRFRISARWLPGDFPNWWSRLGFRLVSRHYQTTWHRRAHQKTARAVHSGIPRTSRRPRTSDPKVIFERRTQNA